ncbi:MAG: hypothetical protein ACRCS6_13445 [Turicibacter sp.]
MIMELPQNIVKFAGGTEDSIKPYLQFKDYFRHYAKEVEKKDLGMFDTTMTFAEKEEKINQVLLAEIERIGGVKPQGVSFAQWSNNPQLKWATFAVVGMMIDAIIPETIIDSIGVYTDIRQIGFGDTAKFDIEPNSLFTVSQSAHSQRTTFVQKQFPTTITLNPVPHKITVQVSMYKVLSGHESLAKFVMKAALSMQTAMTVDAYNAMSTALNALTAPLKVTGFTTDALLGLCQTVTAYNMGKKAMICGTTRALSKILPDAAKGYRILTNSDNMNIQLIKNFYDYDILELNQVALIGSNYGLTLDDNVIYVIAPSSDKLVKGCLEGETLSNSNDFYDNANLTQNSTLNKSWAFEVITNATAGIVTLA